MAVGYEFCCAVPGDEAAVGTLTVTLAAAGQQPAGKPKPTTTTTPAKPQASTVAVSEKEFKITAATTSLKAGQVTFEVKNAGKIPHDLAIKQTGDKTKLIQPGGSAKLTVTLKCGRY